MSPPSEPADRAGASTLALSPYRLDGPRIRVPLQLRGPYPLYQREELVLDTGVDDLANAAVPPRLIWTLVLYALHTHFLFLGDCRVEVPEPIDPADLDLLMATAAVSARAIEHKARSSRSNPLVGRLLPRFRVVHPLGEIVPYPRPTLDPDRAATCFSGGKESLCQVAMLRSRYPAPFLVWHRHGSQQTPPEALESIHRHARVQTLVSGSNVREMVNGRVLHQQLGFHPNLLIASMCHTIQATLALFGYAQRVPLLMQGAERETHSWKRHEDGGVTFLDPALQNCIYQRVVQRLLQPAGDFVFSSPLGPLTNYQTESYLIHRAPDLLEVQESCFSVGPWCSRCTKCFRIAAILAAHDIDPATVGLDTAQLLPAAGKAIRRQMRDYRAGDTAVLGGSDFAAPSIYYALSLLRRRPERRQTFLPGDVGPLSRLLLRARLHLLLASIDVERAPPEDHWDPRLLDLFEHPLRDELERDFRSLWPVASSNDERFDELVGLHEALQRSCGKSLGESRPSTT